MSINDYQVTFTKGLLAWTYKIITPDGYRLYPMGAFISKRNAEADALKRIERDQLSEVVDGDQLRQRLQSADQPA